MTPPRPEARKETQTPETDAVKAEVERRDLSYEQKLFQLVGALSDHARSLERRLAQLRAETVEECARVCDRQVAHIRENAANLRRWESMEEEARARELGALYVSELADTLRALPTQRKGEGE